VKRLDLVRRLEQAGCVLLRHSAGTIFTTIPKREIGAGPRHPAARNARNPSFTL